MALARRILKAKSRLTTAYAEWLQSTRGVDAFLIGSEMSGLTTTRFHGGFF